MKHNTKKKSNWLIVFGALVAVIVAVLIMMRPKNDVPEVPMTESTTASTETTVITESVEIYTEPTLPYEIVELVNGRIETPYGVLNYPEELADHLIIANTGTDPYILEFYAAMEGKQEIRLFDISLGEGSGGNMGMVKTQLGEVPLNITIYTLSFDDTWIEGEIVTAQAMQDVVNEMIDQMAPQEQSAESTAPVISKQPMDSNSVNNVVIETPLCKLYYPARWGSNLRHDYEEAQDGVYKVRFYGKIEGREVQLLFSIYFGGDDGYQLGAVMGTDGLPVPVNLDMAELNLEGWEEADAEILYSMQEASNQLIEKLPLLR